MRSQRSTPRQGVARVSGCREIFGDGASRSAGCSRTPWGGWWWCWWWAARRTVVAVVVRTVLRLLKIAVVSHDSWSGAVSIVSALFSAFERTKFRHLNRPQCKVMLFLVNHCGAARRGGRFLQQGCHFHHVGTLHASPLAVASLKYVLSRLFGSHW